MNTFARRLSLMGVNNGRLFWKGLLGVLVVSSCTGRISVMQASGTASGSVGSGSSVGSSGSGASSGSGGSVSGIAQPPPLVIGTTILHRLTRTEYANTVRDLLGATVDVATLPEDGGDHGFTKDSASQTTAANTITAYDEAAGQIVDSVFADAALKAKLVKCDLSMGTACIKSTLQSFLPNAWRRAVQTAEVDRLMTLAATEATAGGSPEEQLKLALHAALTSSKFVYLLETDPNPADTTPKPITDYELASRLSYFIWNSMPDAALFSLASQGKLQSEATIAQQVTRMLQDPKGAAMASGFAAEWLQLASVVPAQPDSTMFPMVTDALKQSMVQQSTTFFQYVLNTGAPISDLVASDYTFVDAGLAKLYGLPVPTASGFSKVSLAGTTRIGGVLGQASLLMQYASQVRPSAVKRGAWVLNNLLCAPTPSPPADVVNANAANEMDPAFQAKAAMQTARERLQEHRSMAQCAVCHNRIDPLGLGLENYDAVGQYRTVDTIAGNKPIDASGQLVANDPTTSFPDPRGMTQILAKDNRVAGCLAQLLLTFALTRPPGDGEVAYTANRLSGNGDTLANVIAAVATGAPLRQRAGAGL